MSRKRVDIEHKGNTLFFEDGKKVIRVRRDVKKRQNLINYKLVETSLDNNNVRIIYQSTDLDKVASEFFINTLQSENRISVEISPNALLNAEEIEISIKWFDIKDRSADEATIKYISNFLDGLDDSYYENIRNIRPDFKYDYYYLHANEIVPYSSRSYQVFKEISAYLEEYPDCKQEVLPAIARVNNDQAFAFYAFEDDNCKKEIKRDIVRLCNQDSDSRNIWYAQNLKAAFEKQVVDMEADIADGFACCKRKMQADLEAKKEKYLESIPSGKLISLEMKNNKEVETHEEFIEYIDNLVTQYGTGIDNLKINMANDLKKHYLDGKPKNVKLKITVEDFYDKTNIYYINRAIECIIKREQQTLKELKDILSHRAKFDKYASRYYTNVRFKLKKNGELIKYKQHISKEFIVNEFCKILKEDPGFVITITGIDEFRQFSEYLNKKKLALKQLWEYYRNRNKYTDQKKLSDDWIKRNYTWFLEFKKIADVYELEDISLHTINQYHQELNKVQAGNYYPSWLSDATRDALQRKPATKQWVNHRMEFINSLFENAAMIHPDNSQLSQILEYIKETIFIAAEPLSLE